MEPTSQNNNINAINDVRTILSELRSNLSCEEINRIRKKLYKKEAICNFLKEKEQKVSLTNKEKKVLKNIDRYLRILVRFLRIKKKKRFKKLKKYQNGIDYLFNEHNEEDYIKETLTSNNDIDAIQETRKLFNERRSHI